MPKFIPPGLPKYWSPKNTAPNTADGATPESEIAADAHPGSEAAFSGLMFALGNHSRSRLAQVYGGIDSIARTVGNGR